MDDQLSKNGMPVANKIVFFSAQPYDRLFFNKYNDGIGFELEYFETQLNSHTVSLIQDAVAVCVFVNDRVDATVIQQLSEKGVRIIALRCAGFNNVDIEAARKHKIRICRVPTYSPHAVAEHAVAMILTLNRKTHKAYNRVREQNFSLNGLLGFDLYDKTVGVIGTGNIGRVFCDIMLGFGCRVIAFDIIANREMGEKGITFLPLIELLAQSDIISLHCPLNEQTRHIINADTLQLMKRSAMLINTSRGGLIDTAAVIAALKSGQIGYLGIDVYEQEENLFFRDLSTNIIADDAIQRLMSFPNVLITAHQAFFTEEALIQITKTTLNSIYELLKSNNLSSASTLLV
jgi:D-lactate dehydrogenase